jgi:hypothetical protein
MNCWRHRAIGCFVGGSGQKECERGVGIFILLCLLLLTIYMGFLAGVWFVYFYSSTVDHPRHGIGRVISGRPRICCDLFPRARYLPFQQYPKIFGIGSSCLNADSEEC